MSDELEKKAIGADDDGDSDVEAHKKAIGKDELDKKAIGESDDDDVEAHKYAIGKTAVGADDDADDKAGIS